MDRVAIAMSGGVDSATAAAILKNAGFDLVGFSMQLWDQRRSGSEWDPQKSSRCCSLDDIHDARETAGKLGIPYYVLDFQQEFEDSVVRSFMEDYRKGLTPSPCVLCNSRLKFDHLLRMAAEVHASRVATGHYARVSYDQDSGRYLLFQASDKNKDQSYFLFELTQAQLARAMFPLGNLQKDQVRKIAHEYGLPVADKAESQEICFVPDGDYAAFIERHYREIVGAEGKQFFTEGQIVDRIGRVLGTHTGIHHYTVGQRRGLGIAHGSPLYVLEIRPEERRIVVGERSDLLRTRCRVSRQNWTAIAELNEPLRVQAKIRSRHVAAPALISPTDGGDLDVRFESPQPAITPGQACVFYRDDKVVGGGWIQRD